ncbi:MAG: hypothetical protein RJB38_1878 [Pseudomonadota bacterium]|jgi:uncharacterized membrane protein YoaK (UPF0700 family)
MYRLDREDFVKSRYVSLWSALGFQAGFLNAFGFLACGRYVSHVTGVGTQMGIALGEGRPWFALELLGFPLSFIFGSFLSSLVTSARIERGLRPHYERISLLLPITILALLVFGSSGYFGPFGEQLIQTRDFLLLFLLSMVCGMQNGCFATLTRGQIRTTHLTGISTDIGTDLARLWFGKLEGKEYRLTRRTNFSRIATFVAFACGSIVSVKLSQQLRYGALVVPLLTSLVSWFVVQLISHRLDLKLKQKLVENASGATLGSSVPPSHSRIPLV